MHSMTKTLQQVKSNSRLKCLRKIIIGPIFKFHFITTSDNQQYQHTLPDKLEASSDCFVPFNETKTPSVNCNSIESLHNVFSLKKVDFVGANVVNSFQRNNFPGYGIVRGCWLNGHELSKQSGLLGHHFIYYFSSQISSRNISVTFTKHAGDSFKDYISNWVQERDKEVEKINREERNEMENSMQQRNYDQLVYYKRNLEILMDDILSQYVPSIKMEHKIKDVKVPGGMNQFYFGLLSFLRVRHHNTNINELAELFNRAIRSQGYTQEEAAACVTEAYTKLVRFEYKYLEEKVPHSLKNNIPKFDRKDDILLNMLSSIIVSEWRPWRTPSDDW